MKRRRRRCRLSGFRLGRDDLPDVLLRQHLLQLLLGDVLRGDDHVLGVEMSRLRVQSLLERANGSVSKIIIIFLKPIERLLFQRHLEHYLEKALKTLLRVDGPIKSKYYLEV